MARKAANRATNVNAVLLACERSKVLFSLDQQQQHRKTSLMPRKKEKVRANDVEEVYEVEDILDDRYNPKVDTLRKSRHTHVKIALIIYLRLYLNIAAPQSI